jgi:hypothetical protein
MAPIKKPHHGGKTPLEIDDAMRARVRKMAGYGLTQEQVANVEGIGETSLKRRLEDEFKAGISECDSRILNNLKRIAADESGEHVGPTVSAAIFYAKTRLGFHETQRIVHGFDPSVVMEFVAQVVGAIKRKLGACPHCKTDLGIGKALAAELTALSQKLTAAQRSTGIAEEARG